MTKPNLQKQSLITQEYLRSILHYDPATGIFRWRVRRNKHPAGTRAGSVIANGRRTIDINGHTYYAHRLAVLYVTGKWPVDGVDHRSRSPDINHIENLRPATQQQNCRNRSVRSDSASGVSGVNWHAKQNRWHAQIQVDKGKRLHLGSFTSFEKAAEARRAAELRYFGEFAPG